MMVLVQPSFHTTWASLFEMELEPNLLDWNVSELEHELDIKRTSMASAEKIRWKPMKSLMDRQGSRICRLLAVTLKTP